MLELKWIPVHELTRGEIKRQKALKKYCMNRDPEMIQQLIQEYGPFPFLWDFNVPAVIQRLEEPSQGNSNGRALRVSRKENPMGLHSREDVKAAIETHHQPVVGPVGWSSGGYIGSLTPHAVPFHPRSPAHYMPKPLPGRVAVLPYMHEQPITYTGPPLPWVQPGPAALWTTPTAIPILPPPPPPPPLPLPQPPPPYDGRPRPSHMVDDRPRTRHLLDDMHFPAVRGRTPNPYGAIGSALPTRGNP